MKCIVCSAVWLMGGAVLTKKGEVVVLIARILDIYNVTAFVKSSVC